MKALRFLALAFLIVPLVGCADSSAPIPPDNASGSPVNKPAEDGGVVDPNSAIKPEVEPES